MKRSLFFSMVGLILSLLPANGANVTHSTENLVFGRMWMEGGCRANLVQRLHVIVTNNGPEDYQGWWCAFDPLHHALEDSNGIIAYVASKDIGIPSGQTIDVTMEFEFYKPGQYQVNVWEGEQKTDLFTYPIEIAEYQAPQIKGEIRLDMLEKTDEGNVLYGDYTHFKMTGTATITNEGKNTVIGWGNFRAGGGGGIQCHVTPWFGEINWAYPWFYDLGHEIKAGETITRDFTYEFTAVPEEGKEYGIQIDVVGNTVVRVPFIVKQCTNTYWTADGHVKPLPMRANQVLEIPAEALAVDMRGQYEINTVFSVDVSQANPNCLFYLGYLDNVPQGFSSEQNVIRDYEAKTLVVDADYDYYCPMPFKAKTALFNYTPVSESQGLPNPTMSQRMSGAFILPFDATQAWLTNINYAPGTDAGFNGDALRMDRFLGDEEDLLYFEPVTENHLNAYEPYLMSVLPSPVSFYAEDTTIPSTRPALAKGFNYDFVGHTTQTATPELVYRWHADNSYFYLSDTDDMVRPFSALMYMNLRHMDGTIDSSPDTDNIHSVLYVVSGEASTNQIDGVSVSPSEKSVAIYSLSGQRVGTAEMNGDRLTVSGLKPGLYIIGGRKVVVR